MVTPDRPSPPPTPPTPPTPSVRPVAARRAVAVEHVLVVAGGDAPRAGSLALVPPVERVIAADSGLDHAYDLGLEVDVLVGDLDSVSRGGRARAAVEGVDIIEHPVAKDETDLELALRLALAAGARRITVLGGHGGRLDHLLANTVLLAHPDLAGVDVRALFGPAVVTVIRDRATLAGRVGELVSLLPVHGPVSGVGTEGLRYPLHEATLGPGTSRGVSNEFLAAEAVVTVASGTLVAVQPEAVT